MGPHLAKASNPHVLVLSPRLNLKPQWFGDHCAYTMSKYAMSMCVLGMADEFRKFGISVNALWPATMICGIGSCSVPRPSLGGYVTGTGAASWETVAESVDVGYSLLGPQC